MSISQIDVAKLEARLRAIEVILQCIPDVVSTKVLERAEAEISGKRFRHPESVVSTISEGNRRALEQDALAEFWRQMKER